MNENGDCGGLRQSGATCCTEYGINSTPCVRLHQPSFVLRGMSLLNHHYLFSLMIFMMVLVRFHSGTLDLRSVIYRGLVLHSISSLKVCLGIVLIGSVYINVIFISSICVQIVIFAAAVVFHVVAALHFTVRQFVSIQTPCYTHTLHPSCVILPAFPSYFYFFAIHIHPFQIILQSLSLSLLGLYSSSSSIHLQ